MSQKSCGSQGVVIVGGTFAGGGHQEQALCDRPAGHEGKCSVNGTEFVYDERPDGEPKAPPTK